MRTVSFEGLESVNTTFLSALDSTAEGKAVKVSASKTIALAADGDVLHGKAVKVEKDGATDTQIGGYVEFPYTGANPTAGYAKLLADAAGGVKVDAAGREYLVVMVDTAAKIVGFIL